MMVLPVLLVQRGVFVISAIFHLSHLDAILRTAERWTASLKTLPHKRNVTVLDVISLSDHLSDESEPYLIPHSSLTIVILFKPEQSAPKFKLSRLTANNKAFIVNPNKWINLL